MAFVGYVTFPPSVTGFTKTDCDDLLRHTAEVAGQPALVGTEGRRRLDLDQRRSSVRWLDASAIENVTSKLMALALAANTRCRFDVAGLDPRLQLTSYYDDQGGHYDWHLDVRDDALDRKLTIVLLLTDPWEVSGGGLELLISGTALRVPLLAGSVAVFPSYVLHRVTPVRRGSRHSLVTWAMGPPFR